MIWLVNTIDDDQEISVKWRSSIVEKFSLFSQSLFIQLIMEKMVWKLLLEKVIKVLPCQASTILLAINSQMNIFHFVKPKDLGLDPKKIISILELRNYIPTNTLTHNHAQIHNTERWELLPFGMRKKFVLVSFNILV